jgi:ribonuclease BN (tRNA processing enzyme)
MLHNATQSDMDIIFVGTASCTPGVTRGVSCTALRLNWKSRIGLSAMDEGGVGVVAGNDSSASGSTSGSGTWLFDCGESTQLSVQKTSSIKPGKITKIFLTHCHGDHTFGLPGLLCLMGTDRNHDSPPVDIYGPEGLRMWLRVSIRYSVSRVVPPYRVHELMDVPMAPEWREGHRKNGRFYYQWKKEGGGENGGKEENMNDTDYDNEDSDANGGVKSSISRTTTTKRRRWGMQGLAGGDPVSWISRAPMINLEVSTLFFHISGLIGQ